MNTPKADGFWRLLRGVPREAWLCALVACLNAACWSFVTPPFQVPDEPDHYAYVENLALTGKPPVSGAENVYPADLALTLEDLGSNLIRLQPEYRAVLSHAEVRKLQHDDKLMQATHVRATGAAGVATGEPSLYYTLELIPYELGAQGTVLDREELMRLLSAIMAGLTALFVCLFVREALPTLPWAWAVGGMVVALTPLLGFMSGGVTPEALLYTMAAAAFVCLARAFRYGLTLRRAAMIGVVVILGMRTKVNFVGLVPGIAFGFVVLVKRLERDARARTYRVLATLALVVGALAVGALLSGVVGHSELSSREASVRTIVAHGSLSGRIDYIWQLFLPKLPGMPDDFPGAFPSRQIWFNGVVGLYGWLDTPFPKWVYNVALIPAGILALLAIRALVAGRSKLRSKIGEIVTYALMVVGILALIGSASYRWYPQIGAGFGQARYLLPLLALMGAGVTLAIRGAGPRWGPPIAVALLILSFAHDIFSQLQVIARYYA